jgi:hypothetical protein
MTGGAGPKRKGAAWERRVRDAFRRAGFQCERAYGAGRRDDVGDLHLFDLDLDVLIDCKNAKRSERAAWIDEARAKCRAGTVPVVIEPRRGSDVVDAFVTLDLLGFALLLDEIRRLRNGDFRETARGAPAR